MSFTTTTLRVIYGPAILQSGPTQPLMTAVLFVVISTKNFAKFPVQLAPTQRATENTLRMGCCSFTRMLLQIMVVSNTEERKRLCSSRRRFYENARDVIVSEPRAYARVVFGVKPHP